MIQVIDKVLSEQEIDELYQLAFFELMYSYVPNTSVKYDATGNSIQNFYNDVNVKDYGQMVCQIVDSRIKQKHEKFFPAFAKLNQALMDRSGINLSNTLRIKVNILLQKEIAPPTHYNIPHQDSDKSDWSVVFYLNDSDGDTYFFNEFYSEEIPKQLTVAQRITPKRNRAVLFESNRYHASSNPIVSKNRFVINWIFKNEY
jgi:hypothetical protein